MSFEFLTKDEVARRVHISRRYLEQRIAAGTGPETMHVGRRVLVRSDKFAAWVEALTTQSQRAAAAVAEAAPMDPPPAPAACEDAPA